MNQLLCSHYDEIGLFIDVQALKNKKIAVVGASGLIGKYFFGYICYLNIKYNLNLTITGYCRNTKCLESFVKDNDLSECKIIKYDVIKDLIDLSDNDFVIMAASPADPCSYSKFPVETFLTNVMGVKNILDSLKGKKTRMIYLSSGEIYGESKMHKPKGVQENDYGYLDHIQPRSCYSQGKRAAETLCELYRSEYQADICIARLCHVYGPSITKTSSRADAQFLRNAYNHECIVMKSTGQQLRSYCYVGDVCSALLVLMNKVDNGTVCNVSNEKSVITIKAYADVLAELAKVNIIHDHPSIDEQQGFSRIQTAILNSQRLQGFGWRPIFNIKEGLRRTLDLYDCF